MRKLLSLLIVFLLIFTYSMPAYAETSDNNGSQVAEVEVDSENGGNDPSQEPGDEGESVGESEENQPSNEDQNNEEGDPDADNADDSSGDNDEEEPSIDSDNSSEDGTEGEEGPSDTNDDTEEPSEEETIISDDSKTPLGNSMMMMSSVSEESQPTQYTIHERDGDYIYINFEDKSLVKFYVDEKEFYEDETSKQYLDIANKEGELFGVKDDKLYNISNNENKVRPLHGQSINSLVYNTDYFYYIKNTPNNDGNEMLYRVNEDPNTKKKVIEVLHKSAGDLVAFKEAGENQANLYFTTDEGKLIKIDIDQLNQGLDSSAVITEVFDFDREDIFGLAVADGSLFIGYDNKVVRLNANFSESDDVYEFPDSMEIYGMAQGGRGTLSPPVASNVMIAGTLRVGETLTGEYDFNDPDGDDEGESLFKWYLNGEVIDGATEKELEVTEGMINGEIEFEVTPVSVKKPTDGAPEKSDPVTIEEPNLWITVDDGYVLYINGTEIGNDPIDTDDRSWETIDYYYVEPVQDVDDIFIAVKGLDVEEGTATTSGFVLGYKDANGDWLVTDDNWQIFYNNLGDDVSPTAYNDGENSYEWYQEGYRSNEWTDAHIIEDPHEDWPVVLEHDYLSPDANYIWSDDYEGNESDPFDSPVYFRNMLHGLPVYDEEADELSVDDNEVVDGNTTYAHVQLKDEDGLSFVPGNSSDYTVEFFLDGDSIGEGTYDSDGIYTILVTPVYGEENEVTAKVNTRYVDNSEFIDVLKADLKIEADLSVSSNKIYIGESVTATVALIDQYGDPVEDETVMVIDDSDAPEATNEEPSGIYTVTWKPALGENIITATVAGNLIDDEELVTVLGVTTDIEHGGASEGNNDLDYSYEKLVLLAQLRTFMPNLPSNLRNNILIGNEQSLIDENYSLMKDKFNTMIESNPVVPIIPMPPATTMVIELDEPINYTALEAGIMKDASGKIIASMDNVIIDYNDDNPKMDPISDPEWHEISYTGDFENPVVIAQLSSRTGSDHSHIRIKDVDPVNNTFKLFIEEWEPYRNSNHHNFELVSYLVIEVGVHTLEEGYIEAIKAVDPMSISEKTYMFSKHYVDPSVFSQTQTSSDTNQVWMRQNNIQSNSVDVVKQNQSYDLLFLGSMPIGAVTEDYQYPEFIVPHGEEIIGIVVIADDKVTHDVTFLDTDGGIFEEKSVDHGEGVSAPETSPTKAGHEFKGWSLEEDPEAYEAYDFDLEVTEDLTLYPHFDINEYTIDFLDTGNMSPFSQVVVYQEKVIKPEEDPTKDGHTFSYWGIPDGEEGFETYEFDALVTEAFDIYAVWEKNEYSVIFNSNGGSSVPNQSVLYGDTIEKPDDPTRSGYTFNRWTYEGSTYDFDWPVVDDMTLLATWSSDGGGGGGGTTGGGDDATIDAVRDDISTQMNVPVSVETSVLMANDIDAEEFVSVQNAISGSVSLSGTTVTFTPDTDFDGTAYFYYTIADGSDTDNGLVVVTVEGLTEITSEPIPLGGGNPDELLVIEPEIVPLGVIDYSMPYIMGYPDITFRPEREVTRAEMTAIFARILGLDLSNPGEPIYEDVSPEDWYYKYVQAVTRVGLFNGYEGNMFKPHRPVTHAEIASAFSEYWDLRGIEVGSEGNYFSDVSGHWAEDMINRLYNAGISVSYPDGTFRPDRFTTRTELVVMVNRSLNRPEDFKDVSSFSDVLQSHWGYGAIEAATGYQEPDTISLK